MGSRVIDHVTWFVSFAPHDDPRYAVVVRVQRGTSGGTTCAPVARRIYEAIRYRNPERARREMSEHLEHARWEQVEKETGEAGKPAARRR